MQMKTAWVKDDGSGMTVVRLFFRRKTSKGSSENWGPICSSWGGGSFRLAPALHRAHRPRGGRPSKLFRRFDRSRRWSFVIDREISPTSTPIFTGEGMKMQNLTSFSTALDFEPPGFENAAKYLNSETKLLRSDDRAMSFQSLVKFGPRTPENRREKFPHPLKLHGGNVLHRQ